MIQTVVCNRMVGLLFPTMSTLILCSFLRICCCFVLGFVQTPRDVTCQRQRVEREWREGERFVFDKVTKAFCHQAPLVMLRLRATSPAAAAAAVTDVNDG